MFESSEILKGAMTTQGRNWHPSSGERPPKVLNVPCYQVDNYEKRCVFRSAFLVTLPPGSLEFNC